MEILHHPVNQDREESDAGRRSVQKETLLYASLVLYLLRNLSLPDLVQEETAALEIRLLLYKGRLTEYKQNTW